MAVRVCAAVSKGDGFPVDLDMLVCSRIARCCNLYLQANASRDCIGFYATQLVRSGFDPSTGGFGLGCIYLTLAIGHQQSWSEGRTNNRFCGDCLEPTRWARHSWTMLPGTPTGGRTRPAREQWTELPCSAVCLFYFSLFFPFNQQLVDLLHLFAGEAWPGSLTVMLQEASFEPMACLIDSMKGKLPLSRAAPAGSSICQTAFATSEFIS